MPALQSELLKTRRLAVFHDLPLSVLAGGPGRQARSPTIERSRAMAITRPTEPMTKEEQFREVAQILAIALNRWHKDAKRRLSGAGGRGIKETPTLRARPRGSLSTLATDL